MSHPPLGVLADWHREACSVECADKTCLLAALGVLRNNVATSVVLVFGNAHREMFVSTMPEGLILISGRTLLRPVQLCVRLHVARSFSARRQRVGVKFTKRTRGRSPCLCAGQDCCE